MDLVRIGRDESQRKTTASISILTAVYVQYAFHGHALERRLRLLTSAEACGLRQGTNICGDLGLVFEELVQIGSDLELCSGRFPDVIGNQQAPYGGGGL